MIDLYRERSVTGFKTGFYGAWHSGVPLRIWTLEQRLNIELDLRSLFGLLCTPVLIGGDTATPPPPSWALLVIQDRRHLSVTS
jgi:hypothetical protein